MSLTYPLVKISSWLKSPPSSPIKESFVITTTEPSNLTRALSDTLSFLLHEKFESSPQHARRNLASVQRSETYHQLQVLHQLLCQRPATPPLPIKIHSAIDKLLRFQTENKFLTSAASIPPRHSIERTAGNGEPLHLSLWRGDITRLTDITAIVNAANSALLGCFQPTHKCIDNIIHSVAGPKLREEMNRIMTLQRHPEPVGQAKVSSGYNLPAKHVIHTVGPSIHRINGTPTEEEMEQLASCYRSCLDAAETLPVDENGMLSIAFCCISTGLFAFPKDLASSIALRTVIEWCETHPDTPITHIIFDVFEEEDWSLYAQEFDRLTLTTKSIIPQQPLSKTLAPTSVETAKTWIQEADYLLLTAGAGLSASTGLDYTSRTVFAQHYPGLVKLGMNRLYDTIGFSSWPSVCHKWGFFFTHANLIRQWPKSPLYSTLLNLAQSFGRDKYFIRTSNADGLFAANGFPTERIATPQGQYKYLQCFAKCRPDAVFPVADFLDEALPYVDPETHVLTDASLIPHCRFCGTELTLCVRGGDYFNNTPFKQQEFAYHDFLRSIERCGQDKKVVILELGVGLNTPSVLRWPNEELVELGRGRYKLVRVGLGPSACVPFDLVEGGIAVVVDGDCGEVVSALVGGR